MKARLVLALVAAAAAIVGCGGGRSSSSDPASLAPPDAPVFVEVTKPEGQAAKQVDALAKRIAGVDDLGAFIVSQLEGSAKGEGGEVDYEKEIAPWLGESAGIFLRGYDGNEFSEAGAAIQVTDTAAASAFLERRAKQSEEAVTHASYEGVEYELKADGSAFGVIGSFVAYGKDAKAFKAMVKASDGESLADQDSYSSAVARTPSDALADAYADIGGLIDEAGKGISPETRAGLSALGIDPEDATAVASAVPGSGRIEVELSSDVVPEPPAAADTSALLGSLPRDSTAALTSPDAGKSLARAVDRLDAEGIPQEGIPPHKLKDIFKQAGVNLDSIATSIGDLGVFVEGDSESSLGGAAVLIASSTTQAQSTVNDLGLLLRASGTPGVTAIGGKLSGFSIRNSDIGPKPLVVVVDGDHIVIAYGRPAAAKYLAAGSEMLSEDPVFKEAEASLGDIPISGYAAGPAALRLASALVSGKDRKNLEEARPYLSKIDYLALGSESSDDLAKAKLIVGIGK